MTVDRQAVECNGCPVGTNVVGEVEEGFADIDLRRIERGGIEVTEQASVRIHQPEHPVPIRTAARDGQALAQPIIRPGN
jgi:hypothetical protein